MHKISRQSQIIRLQNEANEKFYNSTKNNYED